VTIGAILPIIVMFVVWGLKPGPHTLTLLVRTASHGVKTGLAIALGNNLVHVLFFWAAFAVLRFLVPNERIMAIIGLVAGVYICMFALLDSLRQKKAIDPKPVGGFFSALVTGLGVGLANPLNASFYIAVMPELAAYSFTMADVIVITFSIYVALLVGQGFYIGLADTARQIFADARLRSLIIFGSNMLFGLLGVYVIARSLGRLLLHS
jgi:threonine/homoserine/homoserine lactone efflux protein